MPIYEFECPNGDIIGRLVKPDTNVITCPKCHRKAKKILSLGSFKLKDGGWFADGCSSKKNGGSKAASKQSQSQKRETKN